MSIWQEFAWHVASAMLLKFAAQLAVRGWEARRSVSRGVLGLDWTEELERTQEEEKPLLVVEPPPCSTFRSLHLSTCPTQQAQGIVNLMLEAGE